MYGGSEASTDCFSGCIIHDMLTFAAVKHPEFSCEVSDSSCFLQFPANFFVVTFRKPAEVSHFGIAEWHHQAGGPLGGQAPECRCQIPQKPLQDVGRLKPFQGQVCRSKTAQITLKCFSVEVLSIPIA